MSRSLSPTFTLSTKAVNLLTDIAAKAEWYAIHMENSNAQLFCQASLTKTIYGNLAIAGSTLTEELVHEVVNGKEIVAPVNDIMQAKNAAGVYEVFTQIDPFNVDDLLNAHGMMMKGLTAEVGRFRSTGVGVYVGSQCVHFGPPADRVPYLIQDLFDWLRNVEDNLIIRACVPLRIGVYTSLYRWKRSDRPPLAISYSFKIQQSISIYSCRVYRILTYQRVF